MEPLFCIPHLLTGGPKAGPNFDEDVEWHGMARNDLFLWFALLDAWAMLPPTFQAIRTCQSEKDVCGGRRSDPSPLAASPLASKAGPSSGCACSPSPTCRFFSTHNREKSTQR